MNEKSFSTIGRYRVRSRLGWGGMGEVYLASAAGLEGVERPVAIKLIRDLHQQREEYVSMFIEEAKVAFLLIHPNIVQTYEIGQVGGHYFLVMEYVDGITLEELHGHVGDRLGQPMPVPFVLYIAAQTARALDYAHRLADQEGRPLSIVHRDVSPSNVLLSRDGQVKLADFGLAKSALRRVHSEAGLIKGKLAYMAPEQLAGGACGPEADIYSLGVVTYEMLAGRHPFGDHADLTPTSRRAREVPPLIQEAPHLAPEVVEIVERCLRRDPAERFQSARELGRALEEHQRRSQHAASSYELAEFIERAGREAAAHSPAPHPFDLALGVELRKVEGHEAGGVSTFVRSGADHLAEAGPLYPSATNTLPPLTNPWSRWLFLGAGAFVIGCLVAFVIFALRGDDGGEAAAPVATANVAPEATRSKVHTAPPRPQLSPDGMPPDAPGPDRQAAAATLHVRPRPAGGKVRVDGEPRGRAPLTLTVPANKPLQVRIERAGHRPHEQEVTLEPGSSVTLDPRLVPRRPRVRRRGGFLSVNTDPWSIVYVDGRKLRSTPLVRHPLPAGVHRVRLLNPVRKLSKVKTVRIRPDKETRLSVELGK
jgi:serine/threonine-protein kinase